MIIISLKIKKLDIKAFRGIKCMPVPLTNPNKENSQIMSMLLIGENGTGKSSIVNAIEYFFKGDITSFQGKATGELNFSKHGHHVNFKKEDLSVKIEFESNQIASRTYDSFNCDDSDLLEYIQEVNNSKFILRRRELLDLIESTPSDRYDKIISLIGLNDLNKTEKNLKEVKIELKKENEELNNSLNKCYLNVSKELDENLKSKEDILDYLNRILVETNLKTLDSLDNLEDENEKLLKHTKNNNEFDFQETLKFLIKNLKNTLNKSADLNIKIQNFKSLVITLVESNLNQSVNQIRFFKSAQKILEPDSTNCPLCNQKIDIKSLNSLISDNLESLKESEELDLKVKTLLKSLIKDLDLLETDILDIYEELKKVKECEDDLKDLKSTKNTISKSLEFLDNLDNGDLKLLSENFELDLNYFNKILEKLELVLSKLEISDEDKKFLDLSNKISIINTNMIEINEISNDLEKSNKELNQSLTILDTFKTTKNTEIQNIFTEIKEDLQLFYNFIHPDELHKDVEIFMKEDDNKNSVFLHINSFDKGLENPRAYTSEGHLDTLGLCIFLAFIKRFNKDIPYLILDDVVTTVDSQHRDRIVKLLFEHFNEKQFIITTHDRLWFQQISQMLGPYNLQNTFLKCELLKKDDDIQLTGYKDKWETIEEKLDSGEFICAGNLGRQYYEEVLENISRNIYAKLPLKNSGYSVSDYRNAIRPRKKEILKMIDNEKKKTQIEDAFKVLDGSIIGNLLSHNNPIGLNISIEEVKIFCYAVRDLKEAFSCDNCHRYLVYSSKTAMLMCSGPCKQPSRFFKEN